jgi:allantoinase
VVFDADAEFTLSTADLHYRHPVSPYLGERLQGRVQATFVRGVAVFKDGSFPDSPIGREQRPEEKLAQA